jgi:hypothetical protein
LSVKKFSLILYKTRVVLELTTQFNSKINGFICGGFPFYLTRIFYGIDCEIRVKLYAVKFKFNSFVNGQLLVVFKAFGPAIMTCPVSTHCFIERN